MSITSKKLNPWLEHVKAYKLEHPEVNLKSVLTEARKTYKTVKTIKQETRKNTTQERGKATQERGKATQERGKATEPR